MSLNKQIFTDAGIAMLGNANAGQLLTITKIVVGQGLLSTENQIYPLVALVDWKADVVITRKLDKGDGTMIISGVLTEANMPAGAPFPLRELGVMAKIGTLGADEGAGAHIPSVPGGSGLSQAPGKLTGSGTTDAPAPAPPAPEPLLAGEQLYCASNVFADAPDTVTPGGTSSHAFDITVIIDRATDITVVIGDATVVDCENIPPDPLVGPGWYAQRVGNVFQFKRAVEGTGIELLETADRVTIDSIRNRSTRHFPVQNVAKATYRRILERRAQENGVDFVTGVATAITPMAFYETVMVKGYETTMRPLSIQTPTWM